MTLYLSILTYCTRFDVLEMTHVRCIEVPHLTISFMHSNNQMYVSSHNLLYTALLCLAMWR